MPPHFRQCLQFIVVAPLSVSVSATQPPWQPVPPLVCIPIAALDAILCEGLAGLYPKEMIGCGLQSFGASGRGIQWVGTPETNPSNPNSPFSG